MIKKGFTLAEVMVVVLIFAVVSVSTMMITKSKNNYVNKYMSYTAFTNLQEGIGELIADGYDSNSDGTLEAVLPPFGHAGATPVCNPDPCAGTITVGSLEVAKCDTVYSAINTCSNTTWDSWGNVWYCSTNYWAGAKKACAEQGMRLPGADEMPILQTNRTAITGLNTANWYFTATPYSNIIYEYADNVYTSDLGSAATNLSNVLGLKSSHCNARCVK